MKKTIIVALLGLFGMTLNAQTGTIRIDVTEVVAEWGGTVRVGLFEKKDFPKEGLAMLTETVPVRDIKATFTLENIPKGKYAVAVFQDLNGDGKLNRTIYGQPSEPYAFSNNKFGRFGPPKFAEVAFSVEEEAISTLVIHLSE